MGQQLDIGIFSLSFDDGICHKCKHINADGLTCEAFEKGIPARILTGKIDHSKESYDGDGGIMFEENPKYRGA